MICCPHCLRLFPVSTPQASHEVILIKTIVADHYLQPIEALSGESKRADVVKARHVSILIIRRLLRLSTIAIGLCFDREHSGIIYACKTITDSCSADPKLQAEVTALEARCADAVRGISNPLPKAI